MRVAISFSGLPRMIPRAVSSWHRLIDRYSADVFIHTWNDGSSAAAEMISEFDPISSLVEKPRDLYQTCGLQHYKERLVSSIPYNVFSMWFSISESIRLVRISGRPYDRVVRARFDVDFERFDLLDTPGVIIPGKPPEIYEHQGNQYPGWHDMMAYGDQLSMEEYARTLNAIPLIYQFENSPFFSEFFLSTHLFKTNTPVTHHPVHADIVRG